MDQVRIGNHGIGAQDLVHRHATAEGDFRESITPLYSYGIAAGRSQSRDSVCEQDEQGKQYDD
jgi:hypothetical protein